MTIADNFDTIFDEMMVEYRLVNPEIDNIFERMIRKHSLEWYFHLSSEKAEYHLHMPNAILPMVSINKIPVKTLRVTDPSESQIDQLQLYTRDLFLRFRDLTLLPSNIALIAPRLKYIDCDDCDLVALPDNIGDLYQLQELYLENNRLSVIPNSFVNLSVLSYLDLCSNQLTKLPDHFTQLSNLYYLKMGGNQLIELPENIGELSELTYLDLGYNQLQRLPESIGELKNLKFLSLLGNQLDSLPESIGELKNLKFLFLSGNQLLELPESIEELTGLEILD